MNECCKKELDLLWSKIQSSRPYLHACPEWNYLIIDKDDVEFRFCACFKDHIKEKLRELEREKKRDV